MAELKQLVCPSCGAKLKITGDEVQVKCDAFNDLLAVDGKSRLYVKDWSNLIVFDADGRYLSSIDSSTYGNSLYDVAINNITNEIWVVGYQNKVHQLVVNEDK